LRIFRTELDAEEIREIEVTQISRGLSRKFLRGRLIIIHKGKADLGRCRPKSEFSHLTI
jgi:hypothetical protein